MLCRTVPSVVVVFLFAAAHTADAGAVVTLVPQDPGPYYGGETLTVDLTIEQSPPGSDIYLRGIQLDFNASAPELTLNSFAFDFSAQQICQVVPALCGAGHVLFTSLTDNDRGSVAAIFYGTSLDPGNQIRLPGTGSITVGHINFTLPNVPGDYLLDAINLPGSINPNRHEADGAFLAFDFPHQTWMAPENLSQRGEGGGGQGSGGVAFVVVPEPATLILLAFCGLAVGPLARRP